MSDIELEQEDQPRGRVLVVDDEEKNRRLLADLLTVEGYVVRTANDGKEAVQLAAEFKPEVIMLDIMMPVLDGVEACRCLKTDPATASIPILLATALHAHADRLRGLQAGANDFLTKPLNIEEVLVRVKNAVCAKRLHDQVKEDFCRLQELEQLRDNLTHLIVHDLRSPLMVMSMSFEIVRPEMKQLSPDNQDVMLTAQNACRGLIEMVSSLLDVSRMENGKMPLNRMSCDLCEIARAAAEAMAVSARAKNLTLHVADSTSHCDADRELVRRIFDNLLANAIKFSRTDATIEVDVASTGEGFRCSVSDHGYGIPPEYHKRIFEKFGQVESRRENKIYSTGLGLTFCKLAVETHGGQIGVESQVDQGSTFWFTLPGGLKKERGKLKILIVDDDSSLSKVVSQMLETAGQYEVRTVNDGGRATAVVRDFLPDVAILDIQMPGISGRDIALQMRQNVLTRNTAVVFLTSLLRKKGQSVKKDLDGWPVLGKPATLSELVKAINDSMEKQAPAAQAKAAL